MTGAPATNACVPDFMGNCNTDESKTLNSLPNKMESRMLLTKEILFPQNCASKCVPEIQNKHRTRGK